MLKSAYINAFSRQFIVAQGQLASDLNRGMTIGYVVTV